MLDTVAPLSIGEISNLLNERFSNVVEDVKNIDKMRESVRNDKDIEDGIKAEETFYQEQYIAGGAAPLKNYYSNPTKETLFDVKSEIGNGIETEFSPLGIAYLKKMLENISRDEKQESAYKTVLLQERILATPDKAWEEALRNNAQRFEHIKQAPSDDMERESYHGLLWYYQTLKIQGDENKVLEDMIKSNEESIEEVAKTTIEFGVCKIFSISGLGRVIDEANYLKNNGLDNHVGYVDPVAYQFSKKDDAHLMRFFLAVSKEDYPSIDKPEKRLYKFFEEWGGYLLHSGMTITEVDEKIKPIKTTGDWSEIKNLLRQPFSYAENHIEFSWLKE